MLKRVKCVWEVRGGMLSVSSMMCERVYMMQREAIVNRLNITHSEIKGSRRRLARVESCYFRFPIVSFPD